MSKNGKAFSEREFTSSVDLNSKQKSKKSPVKKSALIHVSTPRPLSKDKNSIASSSVANNNNSIKDQKKSSKKRNSLSQLKKFLGSVESVNKSIRKSLTRSVTSTPEKRQQGPDLSSAKKSKKKGQSPSLLSSGQSPSKESSISFGKTGISSLLKKSKRKRKSSNTRSNEDLSSKPPKIPKLIKPVVSPPAGPSAADDRDKSDACNTLKRPPKEEKKNKKKEVKKLEAVPSKDHGHDSNPWAKFFDKEILGDSQVEGGKIFDFMIQPVTATKFFSEIWEKKPLLVRRHDPRYFDGLFSTSEFDRILRTKDLRFSENIDVVTYTDDQRETHNPDGRAHAPVVWDFYQQGCSVRMLNPQTYSKPVWAVLSLLQEFFGTMAGANVYLTPPGTQGFAPHWDDIEAFVIQLEGKKHWRVYEPRCESETLPQFSSPNFTPADLGKPVLEVDVEAGDLLYFPRGFIHQGRTLEDSHSLHITISVGQRNTWGDFFKMLLPRAIEVAMEEDVEFRTSLPKDYLSYVGLSFAEQSEARKDPKREEFFEKLETLFARVLEHAPVDSAADQMAKRFLEISLPPCLTEGEQVRSVFGQGERWSPKLGRVVNPSEIEPDTKIRIIRKGSVRLVSEEKVCIYHNLENARVYEGKESKCIEIEEQEAEAVELLLNEYPKFVKVENLPLPSLEDQIGMARLLYERGLVLTSKPLAAPYDECDDDDDNVEEDCSCDDCSCHGDGHHDDHGAYDSDDDDDDDE